MVSVGLVCLSAPVFGVVIGGIIYDKMAKEGSQIVDYFKLTLKILLTSAFFVNSFTFLNHNVLSVIFVWMGVAFGNFFDLKMNILMFRCYGNAHYDNHYDRMHIKVYNLFRQIQ